MFKIIKLSAILLSIFLFRTSAITAACVPTAAGSDDSSMILARDITDSRFFYGLFNILDVTHSCFVEQVENVLFCKNFRYVVLGSTDIPVITGKNLCDSIIISERFVRLTFGVRSNDISKIQTVDTNNREHYENLEYLIWDLEPGEMPKTFKIESPEFTKVHLFLNDFNNPRRILAKEMGYKVDGDTKNQDRYRFYNLFDRSFHETVVFDFDPTITHFYTINDELGNCHPAIACQYSADMQTFKRAIETENGKFTLVGTLFSGPSGAVCEFDNQENVLILYRRGPSGFVIPYIVDLKRARPIEKCLLNEDEIDALRSDVYGVSITQGVVRYTQHFAERQIILKNMPGQEIGPKGHCLKNLHELGLRYSTLQQTLAPIALLELAQTDFLPRIREIILKHPDACSRRENEMFDHFFSSGFLEYALRKSPISLMTNKIRPTIGDVLKTADGHFEMPIYYTLPNKPTTDGWFMINVHGGPHVREFNELNIEQQFWTSRGLPYFRLNIRGSTGFGADYCDASDGKWYDVVDDVDAAIKWVQSKGLGRRPIVVGSSFGAYVAAAAFAKGYTNYAIATNGLYDLEQNLRGISDGKTKFSQYDLSNPKRQYGATSAIRSANSVTTHLTHKNGEMLIFAGLKDNNCLPEESRTLFEQMNTLGNRAKLITMAEEGHSPSSPQNLLMMLHAQEAFVNRITGALCEAGCYDTVSITPGVEIHETSAYSCGAAAGYSSEAAVMG